jgi:hypothetical protein
LRKRLTRPAASDPMPSKLMKGSGEAVCGSLFCAVSVAAGFSVLVAAAFWSLLAAALWSEAAGAAAALLLAADWSEALVLAGAAALCEASVLVALVEGVVALAALWSDALVFGFTGCE